MEKTFEGRGGPLGWLLKCRWTFSNLDCNFGTFNKPWTRLHNQHTVNMYTMTHAMA